jgi:hypothetical protein
MLLTSRAHLTRGLILRNKYLLNVDFTPASPRLHIQPRAAMQTPGSGYAWDKWEPGMEDLKRVSPAAGDEHTLTCLCISCGVEMTRSIHADVEPASGSPNSTCMLMFPLAPD